MKKHKIFSGPLLLYPFVRRCDACAHFRNRACLPRIHQLGYPAYFGLMLTVFKVSGAVVIMFPKFPDRLKEWSYAGFIFEFLAAIISNAAVYGFGFEAAMPIMLLWHS